MVRPTIRRDCTTPEQDCDRRRQQGAGLDDDRVTREARDRALATPVLGDPGEVRLHFELTQAVLEAGYLSFATADLLT